MNPAILIASILGLFIGLTITFVGERIFKISLSSTGFGAGLMLVGGITFNVTENLLVALGAGFVAGIISLFLVRSAYRTGLFFIGFAMAAIVVTYIALAMDAVTIDIQNIENIDPTSIQPMLPLLMAGFVASIVTGSLMVMMDTPILRVATAIFGAIIFSLSGFVLTTGTDTLPQSTAQLVSVDLFVWGVGWIPLAIAGVIFQFFGVEWLLKFLQIDKYSRQERARQSAYQASKQPQQRPPQQPYGQQPPPQRYPPQHSPTQDHPQQPYGQQPPQQGNPQQPTRPPLQRYPPRQTDQPPRKPRQ